MPANYVEMEAGGSKWQTGLHFYTLRGFDLNQRSWQFRDWLVSQGLGGRHGGKAEGLESIALPGNATHSGVPLSPWNSDKDKGAGEKGGGPQTT